MSKVTNLAEWKRKRDYVPTGFTLFATLPAGEKVKDMATFQGYLFVVTESGNLYSISENGEVEKVEIW